MKHKWDKSKTPVCDYCGIAKDDTDALEPCEPEDLSIWCAPGQSVSDMLARAAERD